MDDRDNESLRGPLGAAAALLRDEPELRPEWRARVLRDAEAAGRARRHISLTLPAAIAAGIICAVAGGGVALIVTQHAGVPASTIAANMAGPSPAAPRTLPVKFSIVAPEAASVSIVGDFNHWNPTTLPMKRSADGKKWEIDVRLPFGRYSYAFLIDGRLAPDPAAPLGAGDDFGAPNSVLMVKGS